MNCSNCEKEVTEKLDTLMVTRGMIGSPVAIICKTCETGVLTMKIVLARKNDTAELAFEGYLPVSSVK